MASEFRLKLIGANPTVLTISLADLADGSARSSVGVTNTGQAVGALIAVKLTSDAANAPDADAGYNIHLLRSNGATTPIRSDNWIETDAALTVENAASLGSIRTTATTAKAFIGHFDTGFLGPLGKVFGIGVSNKSGNELHATASLHVITYHLYLLEAQ